MYLMYLMYLYYSDNKESMMDFIALFIAGDLFVQTPRLLLIIYD